MEPIALFFALMMTAGVVYLLASLVLGGLDFGDFGFDVDVDVDADIDLDVGDGDVKGIGCNVIAAFLSGAGFMGLFGSVSGWHPIMTILVSLLVGLLLSRVVIWIMRFVWSRQSSDVLTKSNLIGLRARVTVNTPAGKVGEVLVEEYERIKYPMKHVLDEALQKGDMVEIVDVVGGRLHVRKIESA